MEEILEINRRSIYLTIDPLKLEIEGKIEVQPNKFIAFIKNTPPNIVSLGEIIKDSDNQNIIFISQENAREFVINKLLKEIYPPNYYHPLEYTKENLSEIMNKTLIFDLSIDNTTETLTGIMTNCTLAANPPHLPGTATITLSDGSTKNVSFFEIERIRSN